MAALVPQKASNAGTVVTYAAAGGSGDTFPYSPQRELRVKNASGGSINVTLVAQKGCEAGTLHDEVVAVANGAEKCIGKVARRFLDDNNQVHVTYSGTSSVSVAVVEL